MRFTVNNVVLDRELTAALGAVEKKTTMPILGYVKIKTEGDEIIIAASDLDVSITTRIMGKVDKQGELCLPAVKLGQIVKSLKDGDVEFWQKDDEKVEIKSGRSKFNLAGMKTEHFPAIADDAIEFYTMPSGAFAEALKRAKIAISTKESRYTCNGVNLEIENGIAQFISTDGHRMCYSSRESKAFDGVSFKQIVPQKAVNLAAKLADMDTVVGIGFEGDKHIRFQFGNRVMTTRLLSGQFPNWPLIVAKSQARLEVKVIASEMLDLVERVALLADERTMTIHLKVGNGQLEIIAPDSNTGNAFDSMPIEYEGEAFTMAFRSTYIADYLAAINGAQCVFEFRGDKEQMVIRLANEDAAESSFCVVMPKRL